MEEAAKLTQKLVKMKAADHMGITECVTCGKQEHWKELDGGHFVPRAHKKHKLREENIHPQCKHCNKYLNGNMDSYSLFMIDTYGMDAMRELIQSKHQAKKFTEVELLDLIGEYKLRIKEQEDRLAGV